MKHLMNPTSSIVLVLAGMALMIMGIQATGFSVTAKPTNEAICMLIAGAAVIGLVGTLRRFKPG